MQLLNDRLVHTATDIASFLECPHRTVLNRDYALGLISRPEREIPEVERILTERGLALEEAYRSKMMKRGRRVMTVDRPGNQREALNRAELETRSLMKSGVDVIMQAVLFDGTWLGFADALERVEEVSPDGDHLYEVADMKLTSTVHAREVVQLSQYTAQVGEILGRLPSTFRIYLGDLVPMSIKTDSTMAFLRRLRGAYLETIADTQRSIHYPWRIDACRRCPWSEVCERTRRADDHLTQVPSLSRNAVSALERGGISSRVQLAGLSSETLMNVANSARVPVPTLTRYRESAILSLDYTERGIDRAITIRRPPTEPLRGVLGLPDPCQGDIFLHVEQDPLLGGKRFLYALGLHNTGTPDQTNAVTFASDEVSEHKLVEDLLSQLQMWITQVDRESNPRRHIYVWGDEPIRAITNAAARHSVDGHELTRLSKSGRIVNLRAIVRQGVRTARHVDYLRDLDAYSADDAGTKLAVETDPLVAFSLFWQGRDKEKMRASIERTVQVELGRLVSLRKWLLELKGAEIALLETEGRPVPDRTTRDNPRERVDVEFLRISRELNVIAESAGSTFNSDDEARAVRLLLDLMNWHRREHAPAWLEYFAMRDLSDDEFVEHREALGGLQLLFDDSGDGGSTTRPASRRFSFPLGQEHRIKFGDEVESPTWKGGYVLRVTKIDGPTGFIELTANDDHIWNSQPSITAVTPKAPFQINVIQSAIQRVAAEISANPTRRVDGIGPFKAARNLLCKTPPQGIEISQSMAPPLQVTETAVETSRSVVAHVLITALGLARNLICLPEREGDTTAPSTLPIRPHKETAVAKARRLALQLSGTALAIQGPPGTGKTQLGAEMILDLLQSDKRVGITANTHHAIVNLLDATIRAANKAGFDGVRAIQKAPKSDRCHSDSVDVTESNQDVDRDIQTIDYKYNLFAGTAFMYARPAFNERLDAIFIDEAGQMSLANALAVSTAAKQVFLLGDPQQLQQVSRGEHPLDASVSGIGHLIGDGATIEPEMGILLDTTYRMHPDICGFISEQVYDGRLSADDSCRLQCVDGTGTHIGGSGLWYLPVTHEGNRVESSEEAQAIKTACVSLVGRLYTDCTGGQRPLEPKDIIVVAPYNRQVDLLRTYLPSGVEVGTVDKFQGSEAPVVFYSMTASNGSDVLRGIEFLFSLNRVNVAISRARALAVLVCNPALLSVPCHTVEEVKMVNTVCRFVELARVAT